MSTIEIPESVTIIEASAFSSCINLSSVTISKNVTRIGESAFWNCNSLHYIKNYSDLIFTIGSKDYGEIAYYAKVIEDKNGNIVYKDTSNIIENDFLFTVDSNGIYKLIAYLGTEETITLPQNILGKTYDIYYMRGVKNVIIPAGITSIGYSAFSACRSLTSITIPESVTSIGSNAFWNCSSLTSITIPNGVTSIGDWAFSRCSSLTSIMIGEYVISIGSNAFAGCSNLESIVVSDNNANYSSQGGILYNKAKTEIVQVPNGIIDEVVIPDGVTSIRDSAFSGCGRLTSITIPDSVTSIGSRAFSDCSSLTSITIPYLDAKYDAGYFIYLFGRVPESLSNVFINGHVTSIGDWAFYGCSGVTSITIPDSVTSIGDWTFYGCSGLTSITIPNSVTSIGRSAFDGCSNLNAVYITDIVAWCNISINSRNDNPLYYAHNLYLNNELVTDLIIPDSVTSIDNFAFSGCGSLTSIILPNNLHTIGSQVFSGCNALNEVFYRGENDEWRHVVKASDWDEGFTGRFVLDQESGLQFESDDNITEFYLAGYNGVGGAVDVKGVFAGRPVTEVYPYGLYNNQLLTMVNLPDSIKIIGAYAFAGCSVLTDFIVPDGVVKIGIGAFANTNLVSIDLTYIGQSQDENTYIGWIFGAEDFTLNSMYVPETLIEVNVANTNRIPNYAFYGCENVVEFNFSEDITQIGNYAFYGCLSLPQIELPNTVTAIGNYAFADCRALTEFVFPNSVVQVGDGVLHRDNNIKSITIGSNLALSGIADYVNDNPLFGLEKSSSLLAQYIVVPENTEFITDEYGVLYLKLNIALNKDEQNVPVAVVDAPALSNLSYYTLPQYIVEIMSYAFAYNSTLKTVELEYVRRIGNNAFMECDKLINVIFSDSSYDTPERLREYIGHKQYSQRIESRAFMGCVSLLKADLQVSTIIEIGEESFLDCNLLKTVMLGDNIRKLGSRAFGSSDVGGSTLERIEVSDGNPYFSSVDGVLFAINDDGSLTLSLYPACKPVYVNGEILYVNGETQYATEYSLPNVDNKRNAIEITGIESYAFTNAVYLDDLYIDPESELRVGDYAFADSMIQHIYIGKNVMSLGLRRGEGEYTVFSGDRYLTDIEVSDENPYYSSISGVLFDKGVTRLIKYPAAKVGREYIIPASVDTIASMAFKDNKNIGLVTVRSDLQVVGLEAFYGCSELQVIYFNHVYAPHTIMENAFTVNTNVNVEESQVILGYSPSCYDDYGDSYGWCNYDGIYNTLMYDIAPIYEPKHGVSIYYAVVVVDNSGRPLDGTWVSITDYNGNTETVEARNGMATFWSYAKSDGVSFALSFQHKYDLKVYDGDGLYTPYINDGVYLDGKTLVTYITLEKNLAALSQLQPALVGVSCNDKEINSESVEINKAAFDYEGYELKDMSLGYSTSNVQSTGIVHESIDISVIAYFNSEYKANVGKDACVLLQNGVAIKDCELMETEIRDDSATYTFSVPVYRLVPETPIMSEFTMTIKDIEFTADTVLNIDVIDFSITQDDINLGTDDVTLDLSAAGEVIMKLLDGKSKSFNISKNVKAYIDIEDSEITVGLRGDWKKTKSNSTNISSLDAKTGFEKYKQPHNKGSYFYAFKGICYENRNGKSIKHTLTYNIRYYKDPNIEDFYYYWMYIYEEKWENNIATLYGKVNGGSALSTFGFPDNAGKKGRERVAQKAQISYLGHYSKLLNDLKNKTTNSEEEFKKIVANGYVYSENEKTTKYQSTTSQTFSVALTGELVFKYDRDNGLHLTSGSVSGELGYVMKHQSQFVVWVVPITLDVQVDLNGKVNLNVVIDENRKISMDEAKLTVSANITASLGVGCSLASAGVTGNIGTVFILDFYPEFGVESWNINGKIGVYAKILWWRKDWTLWQGSYDIIKPKQKEAILSMQSMSSMYLASAYERITPNDVSEDATLFVSGSSLYKVYYMNTYGQAGYDENNFAKLTVAKWSGSEWSDGIIIDNNGCNDAGYRLFDDNGNIKLIFAQSDGITDFGIDDIYNDAEHIVIKTADILGGIPQNVSTIVTHSGNYSYLHQINIVNSIPTAVWVENADNNVFGVSPYNYIDANGNSHVYATTANSVWMSRYENGRWGIPVCLKDELSAITNLVLTNSGDVYYIEDANGDLSDTNDRTLFGKKRYETDFATVNSPLVSVTNAYAEDDCVVYRAVAIGDAEEVGGLYKVKNSSTDTILVLPEETIEQMPDNFKPITDENGNVFAYLYYNNETWQENGKDITGSVLYGVFYDASWSEPVKLIEAAADEYITSFDAYKNTGYSLLVTVSYTNADSSDVWSITQIITLEEKVALVEYEQDYAEQILYITVTNKGAASSEVSATVDGTDYVLTNKLSTGATETYGIRVSDNKTPVIKLFAGTRVFGTIKGVDFNYADFAVYSKQLVIGGQNILLVAVRNNGNIASEGELFIKSGTDISEIEMVGERIVLPNISVGGIYYLELSLNDYLSLDSDVVTLFAKSKYREPSDSLLSDNTYYVTYNDCTYATGYAPQKPKLYKDYVERLESDSDSCIIEYNDCAYYVAHIYYDKTLLTGNEYRVNESNRQIELFASYIATLPAGDSYIFKVEFVGVDGNYTCEFKLRIFAEYKVTWTVDDGAKIENTIYIVKEGIVPKVEFEPSHIDEIGYTYEFIGWDSNGDGVTDKISATVSDMTYTALFERKAKVFTVTWEVNNMEYAEQYCYGSQPTFMGNLNKSGYNFIGWDTNSDNTPDVISSVMRDISYIALYEEIPVHDIHTSGDWIVDEEATCTKEGRRYKECIVCGELTEEETISKLNHTYGDWIIDLEASCSQSGLKHRICTVCNDAMENAAIDKLDHVIGEWITDIVADCTHAGIKHRKCENCGELLEVEEISATGHHYGDKLTVEATCSESGYTYYICAICDDHKTDAFIKSHGHNLGEWIVDSQATEDSEGHKHKQCTVCGEIIVTETISTIANSFGNVGIETSKSISIGTLIGIAVGCAVVASGITFAVVWIILRKRKKLI